MVKIFNKDLRTFPLLCAIRTVLHAVMRIAKCCASCIAICAAVCALSSCNIDLLGIFISTDLDERLESRHIFNFLTNDDFNITLPDTYSFIVLSDTHIEDGNMYGLENMTEIITEKAANNALKFVVILGDITQHGSYNDIRKFIEFAQTLSVPCYPVIGNHDIYFGNWPIWKENIGSTSYKVSLNNTTLFILDSANSFIGAKQLDWLESELKNTSGRIFVYTHCPLFATNPVNVKQLNDTSERARIVSMLVNRCDMMFMGHSHQRNVSEAGNVTYINIEDFKKNKTYCFVTVTETSISYVFESL
ncbi:MAG: metallophosphoesterase [Treponema sp.]|nr:metallophosphoesterase [Treponema sp.]